MCLLIEYFNKLLHSWKFDSFTNLKNGFIFWVFHFDLFNQLI